MLPRKETFLFAFCFLALTQSVEVCLFGLRPCSGANAYCAGALCACNAGYQGDGTTCTRVCSGDAVTKPENGTPGTCKLTGSKCAMTCNTGYYLSSGSLSRTCDSSGSWSPSTAVCSPVDCGPFPVPDHASADPTCTSTTYKSSCSFTCEAPNYQLSGQRNYTCNANGDWERATLLPVQDGECKSISCGPLPLPANAVLDNCPLTTRGSYCSFKCLPPFELAGQNTYLCNLLLKWDRAAIFPLQNGYCFLPPGATTTRAPSTTLATTTQTPSTTPSTQTPSTQTPSTQTPSTQVPSTTPSTQAPSTTAITEAPDTTPLTQSPPSTQSPGSTAATTRPPSSTAATTQSPNTTPSTQSPSTTSIPEETTTPVPEETTVSPTPRLSLPPETRPPIESTAPPEATVPPQLVSGTIAYGSGLGAPTANEQTSFTIQIRDENGNPDSFGGWYVEVTVNAPNGQIPAEVVDNNDGTYSVIYTPTVSGSHEIVVEVEGISIQGSPFTAFVAEATTLPPAPVDPAPAPAAPAPAAPAPAAPAPAAPAPAEAAPAAAP